MTRGKKKSSGGYPPDFWYLETSAAVQVLTEPRGKVRRWFDTTLKNRDIILSSQILQVELTQFFLRYGAPQPGIAGDAGVSTWITDRVDAVAVTPEILAEAMTIRPALNALGAIHLATAWEATYFFKACQLRPRGIACSAPK